MRDTVVQSLLALVVGNPDISGAVKTASEFEKLGIIAVLFLAILAVSFLYWSERKRNFLLTKQIIDELKVTNAETLKTMIGVQHAVDGHTRTLEAIMPFIRSNTSRGGTP